MTVYEELVERCAAVLFDHYESDVPTTVRAILAEVSRTLEDVTPEMYATASDHMISAHDAYAAWQSMRLASPLTAPHSCCGKKAKP